VAKPSEDYRDDRGDGEPQPLGRQREDADGPEDGEKRAHLHGFDRQPARLTLRMQKKQAEGEQRERDDPRHVTRAHIGGAAHRELAGRNERARRDHREEQAEEQVLPVDPGTRHRPNSALAALDAGFADDAAPARRRIAQPARELGRRAGADDAALLGDLLLDLRHREDLADLGIQPRHRRRRRAGAGQDALPGACVTAGKADLLEGRKPRDALLPR